MAKKNNSSVIFFCTIILALHVLCRVVIPELIKDSDEEQVPKKVERFNQPESSLQITGNVGESLLPRPSIQNNVFLINLKRRPDRLQAFDKDYAVSDMSMGYELVEAVDGSKIDVDEQNLTELAKAELKQLETTGYRSKHYQLTRGAIGCYLSHVKVWKEIVRRGSEISLVFEDDTTIPHNIQSCIDEALTNPPSDWDMILLGVACHSCTGLRTRPGFMRVKKFWLTHAYLIKKQAIEKLFKSDALFPIAQQIDSLLSEMSNTIKIYALKPGVCQQRPSRTDIQAPLKQIAGEDPLERIPVGISGTKNRSISTKITNSMIPTTYESNGGSASMPKPVDLNNEDDDEEPNKFF